MAHCLECVQLPFLPLPQVYGSNDTHVRSRATTGSVMSWLEAPFTHQTRTLPGG